MGTTNVRERPQKRRNVRQAKRADRLEPNGTRPGMVFVLWTIMDTQAAGAQDGFAPSGNSCGTGEAPHAADNGRRTARNAVSVGV